MVPHALVGHTCGESLSESDAELSCFEDKESVTYGWGGWSEEGVGERSPDREGRDSKNITGRGRGQGRGTSMVSTLRDKSCVIVDHIDLADNLEGKGFVGQQKTGFGEGPAALCWRV